MSVVLYHYVHCPFCVRVRMVLGYLQIPYASKVLAYDDEEAPIRLSGKKMLPILQYDQAVMNESLDIIAFLDKKNILDVPNLMNSSTFMQFNDLLNLLGEPIHSLAMPYWIYTPEFTASAREYFQKKKEIKRGPFKELARNRKHYEIQLAPLLDTIESKLMPFYESKVLTLKDILLASHLWGLYILPEFQFSEIIHHYLQEIKGICHFDYHQDFWS
jgi:glutaredoxin 2